MRDLAKTGADLIAQYGKATDPRAAALNDRNDRDKAIRAAGNKEGLAPEEFQRQVSNALLGSAREYEKALKEIDKAFQDEMISAIHQIGDSLGGTLGKVVNAFGNAIDAMTKAQNGDYSQGGVLGGIAKLFGGPEGNRTSFGKGVDKGASEFFTSADGGIKGLGESFGSFTDAFGKGGSISAGIGQAVGGAMMGYQMGQAVGGIGELVFGKDSYSKTGAEIGGTLGSIGGPIGSAIGSVAGAVIGGLIKKKSDYSTTNIGQDANGLLVAGDSFSRGLDNKESSALANAVVDGVNSIASRLGAQISGQVKTSIGIYDDKYRVSTTGWKGELNFRGQSAVGLKNFGEDRDAAVAFAISDALGDITLTGISDFSARVVKQQKNGIESALQIAEGYENVLKALAENADPVGYAVAAVTKEMNTMVDAMKAAGATAAELANVEQVRSIKMDKMRDEALKTLTDFQRDLFGDAGGVNKLDQYNSKKAEFQTLADLARAGGSIDNDKFVTLGQNLNDLSRDIFGSTAQYQADRELLLTATGAVVDNVNQKFDDAAVLAIQAQTDEVKISNDLLRKLVEQNDAQIYESPAKYGGRFVQQNAVSSV